VSGSDGAEKTEEATPERRRKAREEGQFARAKDTGAVAATFAVLVGLAGFGDQIAGVLSDYITYCLRNPTGLVDGNLQVLAERTAITLAVVTLPIASFAAIAAIAAGVMESGFQPRLELAAPKWKRLDPIGKLQQLFSPKQAATNTLLTLARVAAVSTVTYLVMRANFATLLKLSRAPLAASSNELMNVALRFAAWATLTLIVLSALDYIVAHFRHEKQIMMSRQEMKEEHHQQEGDPRVKARQRARGREIASKGLVKVIQQSDVIITNPTHIAVALRYKADEGAPVVNAKGYDEVAQYIKELARKHEVTIVENKPLARALAKTTRVGKVIPVELFAAVAEVLAFVYRARQRRLARGLR
jgi:flagellar biosynthesis protein FlhB